MVNAELLRLGYSQVLTMPPNVRYQCVYRAREREAWQSGRGLWRSS